MATALPETENLGAVMWDGRAAGATWLIEIGPEGYGTVWTYGDLDREADAIARGVLARGLARGDRVGLMAGNSARFLVAYFGLMRAGLVPVLLNWKQPAAAIAHMHRDSDIALTLTDAARAGQVPKGAPLVPIDGDAWNDLCDPGPFDAVKARDDVANILYTSGSTGKPKGVPLTHGGYGYAIQAAVAGVDKPWDATALVAAPLYHMNGLFFAKMMAASGGVVALMPRFDARAYLEAVTRHRCTLLSGIPTMMTLALRETDLIEGGNFSHVANVMIGSSPVSRRLVDQIGVVFPKARLTITYGTTEAGPTAFAPHPDGVPTPPLSLGVASPHVQLRLVGGPSDAEGVLQVKSPVVMPGYLNLPGKTAERLNDGWFDTGDIMRRDDEGFYYFVDRADDMFVVGGENVQPGEVETLLMQHPDIAQAAVVPVPDEVKGMLPAAFVVPAAGRALAPEAVKAHALANGPAYAHPRFVEIVEALPLSGTNKVDRKALKERAAVFSRDGANTPQQRGNAP